MANVVISGDTSGAITLAAPAVAGTTTLTLPATSGTVLTSASTITPSDGSVTQAKLGTGVAGNGPAFSAYKSSAQSLSAATWTKLTFDVEEFDTNSNFASSRFTPTVAGYYQINGSASNGLNTQTIASIYKNGSIYKAGVNFSNGYASVVSSLVYLNGTTDYVELYGYFASSGNSGTGIESLYFNGSMVRAA